MTSDRSASGQRLVSLDVFRGLIIAGMILVTDPGTYSMGYGPLRHSLWENPTATDMISPSFLFIVGVAMTFSFASRLRRGDTRRQMMLHVISRSIIIFLLGLVLNGFPDYRLSVLRLPGILQHIAVCYLLGAVVYLAAWRGEDDRRHLRRRATWIGVTAVVLLALYWALLKFVPVPGFGAGRLDSLGSLPAWIDRTVFSVPHIWLYGTTPGYGVTYDPDGLLSTMPVLAIVLFGVLAGDWLLSAATSRRKAVVLAIAGAALISTGLILCPCMPLIKKIWTPTFAVFSTGVAFAVFSLLYFVLDIKAWRRWASSALVFGTNAILAFALSTIITILTDRIHVTARDGVRTTLHQWSYLHLFASWLSPVNASLAYALVVVAINLALIYPLYRSRIFLRL